MYRADLRFPVCRMQNMEKLLPGATRVVARSTARQAEPAQHWDDRKSQSSRVMREICPRRSGLDWQESLWNRLKPGKANDERLPSLSASRSCRQWNTARTATHQYRQVVRWTADRTRKVRSWTDSSRMKGNFHVRFLGVMPFGIKIMVSGAGPVRPGNCSNDWTASGAIGQWADALSLDKNVFVAWV